MVSLAELDLFLVRGRDVAVCTLSVIRLSVHHAITLSLVMRHVRRGSGGSSA